MNSIITQLKQQTNLTDNPALISHACHEAGLHRLSPNNWECINLFTGERYVVTVDKLIEALERKQERIKSQKPPLKAMRNRY